MADAAIDLERSDATSYSPIAGTDRGTADRIARPSALSGEGNAGSPSELASLVRLGAMKLEQGNEAEAEECFRKALEIGDRTVGADHPDLILLLNDLTRIYLRQSAFAAAEPLLLRLLELKRSKGEDHPEVATVLASLATVRQALGRHESAEQLWRRVLEIRERTLAPNHFAIAMALERFGDACAARGKIRESLAAFQRAYTIRERTLGADHSSLRSSRERIADLQLQASDGSIEPNTGPANSSAVERFRLRSGEPIVMTPPAAPAQIRERSPAPASRKATVVIQGPFTENIPGPFSENVPAQFSPSNPGLSIGSSTSESASAVVAIPVDEAAALESGAAGYRHVLESIRDEFDAPSESEGLGARIATMLAALTASLGKPQVVAGIVVIVIASLLLAVATNARGFGEIDQTIAQGATLSTQQPLPATTLPAALTTVSDPAATSVAAATPTVSKPAQHPRVAEERITPKKVAEQKPETKKLTIPSISSGMMSRLDSVASRAASAGAPISFQPAPTSFGNQRASFEAAPADQSAGPQRARLIGELPSPRVPAEAIDVEGEVRVRFSVDTEGRPVMTTMTVVKSPNALLTTAVKKVIPGIRFEPARTGGSDSRVVSDVVEVGFRFARQQR